MNGEEALAAARAAGLRYVSDQMPGIGRRKHGDGFEYVGTDGRRVTDEADLDRIRSLAVPPAYADVWICPSRNGHIQATGRDARGRKQYRYHAKWREVRDETKYARMLDFAKALPAIRKRVAADMRRDGMPREKALAAVVALLESTTIRVGNDEYAKDNGSFGLTTLRNRHVAVSGSTMRFTFKGKSGVKHAISLSDRRLANIVRRCQDIPGQQLFEYLDVDGTAHEVDSSDVNEYIREIAGDDFSAKDFRTWIGTVSCATLLAACDAAAMTQAERKGYLAEAIKQVARRLGNTPTICRKCYVHPDVLAAYIDAGTLGKPPRSTAARGLSAPERAVITFLKRRARKA
ncbi:MAG TPA: DNA topoisomerase IB [Candidatus Baltobacteraceae bacterium]